MVLRPSENICCIIGSLKLKLYEFEKETVWFLLTGKLISYSNKKATFLLVFVVFEEMKYMLLYVVSSFISTLKWYYCSLFFWYYITTIRVQISVLQFAIWVLVISDGLSYFFKKNCECLKTHSDSFWLIQTHSDFFCKSTFLP